MSYANTCPHIDTVTFEFKKQARVGRFRNIPADQRESPRKVYCNVYVTIVTILYTKSTLIFLHFQLNYVPSKAMVTVEGFQTSHAFMGRQIKSLATFWPLLGNFVYTDLG